ncbi:FkbM family methyltransferase [Phyllobacterium sp. CCNWLW109]|uniref:FkbM family methyltransferase n=1 Tax=Phyllobacterium sp. CCNWLW109 TaxID=3127479 RepID=UPI003076A529
MESSVKTEFGSFAPGSKERIDLTVAYENSAIHSFKTILQEINASHMLDIGANIGVYSVYCADLPKLESIHAFEPAPAAFELMQQNFRMQTHSNKFRSHQVAASSECGNVQFKLHGPMSGANAIVSSPVADTETINVSAAPIDSICTFKDCVIGVKIDVEGHEVDTLQGAQNTLRNNFCFIQIEVYNDHRFDVVRDMLISFGYRHQFSLRNDHLFIHSKLVDHATSINAILYRAISADLRALLDFRLKKDSNSLSSITEQQQNALAVGAVIDTVDAADVRLVAPVLERLGVTEVPKSGIFVARSVGIPIKFSGIIANVSRQSNRSLIAVKGVPETEVMPGMNWSTSGSFWFRYVNPPIRFPYIDMELSVPNHGEIWIMPWHSPSPIYAGGLTVDY